MGKEGFGVLGHTTGYGVLRRKRTGTELAQRFLVDERTQVFLIYLLYLLILMGTAERSITSCAEPSQSMAKPV